MALLGLWCAAPATASCPVHHPGTQIGLVGSIDLVECSGLAASRHNAGVIWAHNDSGDSARLFAMNTSGTHLGIYTITGASFFDWEDIAIGPGPTPGVDYLYIADTGDNFNFRPTVQVYRIAEPVVNANQSPMNVALGGVQTITLAYSDGPRDAETIMVDTNGDIYIVTKRVSAVGRVYRAPFPQSTSGTTTMNMVAQLPWGDAGGNGGATGGDISSDGSAVIVRRNTGYTPAATLWRRAPGTNLWDAFSHPGCDLTLISERQGEAICFKPGTMSFYTTSEGAHQPLYYFDAYVPADVTHNGQVNVDDLLAVINAWGRCPAPPTKCPADVTGNGTVNVDDLLAVINGWG